MNTKDRALKLAAKAFLCLHAGGTMTPEQYKIFADLCCLALPMKYRFTRAELEHIKTQVQTFEPVNQAFKKRGHKCTS